MSGHDRIMPSNWTRFYRLTPRQVEVVNLIRLGLSNKEIARALGITTHTVKVHLHHIFYRLEVSNRRQIMIRFSPQAPVGREHWPTPGLGD
jgi:DNA-binding NarL/FixJ family response regulator